MATLDERIKNILEKGKFYNPALSHYESIPDVKTVFCDRCNKSNLTVCIGYEDCDLCMLCVHELTEKISGSVKSQKPEESKQTTKIVQQPRIGETTRMMQQMFHRQPPKEWKPQKAESSGLQHSENPDNVSGVRTRMMQQMYRPATTKSQVAEDSSDSSSSEDDSSQIRTRMMQQMYSGKAKRLRSKFESIFGFKKK